MDDNSKFEEAWSFHDMHILQSLAWAKSRPGHKTFITDGVPVVVVPGKSKLLKSSYATVQRAGFEDLDFAEWGNQLNLDLKNAGHNFAWLVIEPNKTRPESDLTREEECSTHLETIVIDISGSQEEILSAITKTNRKYIRRAENRGTMVTSHTEGDQPLQRFLKVMQKVHTSKKYVQVPEENYINTWETLSPMKMAYIMIATHEGEDVAASMRVYSNNRAYQLYGGTTDKGRELQVNEYLIYQSMLQAKKLGNTSYDMWGAAPFSLELGFVKGHELSGISRFKLGFGGQPVAFEPPRVIINKPLHWKIFTFEKKLAKLKLKMKKR